MVDLTPVNYLAGLGGLENLPNPARDMAQAQALRTSQLQQQVAQAQLQKVQNEQQREQAFQQDVMALGNDPTPQGIANLIRRYPQFADELKSSHDIQDEAKRDSDFLLQSQIYSAASNGRYDLAADMLENYSNADVKSGGVADPMDQAIVQALRSGDPAEQKRALSMIGLSVAAINPKKFGDTYKTLMGGGEDYTLAPGSMRYDSNNQLVASAPFAPEYRNVGPGDTVVEIDRNVSSGTSTGNSPTAALNNPGAIRFDAANQWQGQVGNANGFVQFDTFENGKRAHRKLIANQIKAGYDTPLAWASRYAPAGDGANDPQAYAKAVADGLGIGVNDKIPVSAVPKMADISARVEGMGSAPSGGGSRVVATGGQKPSYQVLTPQENQALGLNPDVKYQRSPDGQITALGGQDTKTKIGRAVPQSTVNSITPRVEIRDNLTRAVQSFEDAFAGNTFTGGAENLAQALNSNWGTPGQRDWWSNFKDTDNLIRNQLFGSALTAHEKKAYEETTVSPRMDPKIVRKNLERRAKIISGALERQKKVLLANKYEPEAVEQLFAPDPTIGQRQLPAGFKIIGVRPK